MNNQNEIFKKIMENLIECPVCRNKSLRINDDFVCCKNCGRFAEFSINTETFQIVSFELEKEQTGAMPLVRVGDIIVRIDSVHTEKLNCYEVNSVQTDGVVSQPAGFFHSNNEIVAVYRFDGLDFKCIWERKDYKEYKKRLQKSPD